MSVFKLYLNGISSNNMVFSTDRDVSGVPYGDATISMKLKKEVNKADSLEFMILPMHTAYDSFEKKKTFVFLTRDGKCIFRGRVSDIKTDIYKQRTITCEGDLAFLADSVQSPNKKTSTSSAGSTKKKKRTTVYIPPSGSSGSSKDKVKMSVETYFRSLIAEHNVQVSGYSKGFTVGQVTVSDASDVETFERTSFQDTSSIISSDLLSVYGGVLRTRYENDTAYIDWLDDYTDTTSQNIRFGVNLIDIDQEPPTDENWSVLLASGDENITIASANDGDKFLVDDNAVEKYGYIVHHHQFNNAKTASALLKKARRYLRTHAKIFPDNLIIKAIDLQLIGESDDPLELGEKIKVVSSPHGINKTMACIALEMDIFNPENNSYTIGHIMPPDKEKKKEPLSSKQATSSASHSRGIGNNANAISGMQEDINVNANNINVNAENIAVNALNIAVNAENIAVVAKNIAIAADTIDVKAREITLALEDVENNLSAKIDITSEHLSTEFNKKIYGENEDGSGGIYHDYTSKIEQTAEQLTSSYTDLVNDTKTDITTEYTSEITQTAESINTEVRKKVGKTEIISSINQTAETIQINAQKIDLSGYVTATQLAATNANITNLRTGTEKADHIKMTNATIDYLNVSRSINGTLAYDRYSPHQIKRSSNYTYSGYILSTLDFDLSHSHSVTTNSDGTITIGGAVATDASGRSFRIADTKAYKDGVSAAIDSVTVSSVGRNATYSDTYDYSSHNTTIHLKATASNGKTKTDTITAYGSNAYNDGYEDGKTSVTVTSVGRNATYSDTYDSSSHDTTIHLKATASNGETKTANITAYGSRAYNDGYSDGIDSVTAYDAWIRTTSSAVADDDYRKDCANIYLTIQASNGDTKNITLSKVPMYMVYDQGRKDCVDDIICTGVKVNSNGSATVYLDWNGNKSTKSVGSGNVIDNHK